jgi:pentatricopeptide repeat protein
MIDGYIKKGSIREAERIKKEMEKKGLVPDMYTYASLFHGHCVSGKLDVAQKLFEEMKQKGANKPNVVAYTALISGLAKEGRSEEAFELYDDMLGAGLTPDDSLYSALVGSLHTDNTKHCLPQTG